MQRYKRYYDASPILLVHFLRHKRNGIRLCGTTCTRTRWTVAGHWSSIDGNRWVGGRPVSSLTPRSAARFRVCDRHRGASQKKIGSDFPSDLSAVGGIVGRFYTRTSIFPRFRLPSASLQPSDWERTMISALAKKMRFSRSTKWCDRIGWCDSRRKNNTNSTRFTLRSARQTFSSEGRAGKWRTNCWLRGSGTGETPNSPAIFSRIFDGDGLSACASSSESIENERRYSISWPTGDEYTNPIFSRFPQENLPIGLI